MTIPYTFAGATTAIPLAQLDANFASPITLGNVAMTLSNTYNSIGNLTLTNVTISSASGLAANTVAYANASGVLGGSANMTFDGSTLTTLNSAYTGTLTGGTGIVNLGSGQFYKDASGNVGIGTSSPAERFTVFSTSGSSNFGATAAILDGTFGAYIQGSTQANTYAFIGNFKYNYVTPSSSYAPYGNAGYGISMGTNAIQFYAANAGGTGNFTPTEKMRLTNNGTVILAGGNTSATGTGIAFPATQSASSDANTLDDYEKGTWTPTGNGIALAVAQGFYTKIGNVVEFSAYVSFPSNSNVNNAVIGGLPFTCASAQGNRAGVSTGYSNQGSAITMLMGQSSTTITPYLITGTAVTNVQLSSKDIYFGGTYTV